jgi:hypothetical protein
VSILGQTVDLSQVRSLLQPVSQGLSGIISQVGLLDALRPSEAHTGVLYGSILLGSILLGSETCIGPPLLQPVSQEEGSAAS